MIRENIEILVSEISLLARAKKALGYWCHLRFNEVKKESIDFELLLPSEKNSRINLEQRATLRTKLESALSLLVSTLRNGTVE